MLTDEQKILVERLREDNQSYTLIAVALNTTQNTIKGYCNKHGLGGKRGKGYDLKEKEREFKERFERMFPDFLYHSGYIGRMNPFKCQCRTCGHIEERNSQCAKVSRKNGSVFCKVCAELGVKRRTQEKQIQRAYDRLHKPERIHPICTCVECGKEFVTRGQTQKYCSQECYEKAKGIRQEIVKECAECGQEFTTMHDGNICCSKRCRRKRYNRIHRDSKDKRISQNGKADYSITLLKLINRDNGICHLCGNYCDENDIETTEEGYMIAGNNYPSIDHCVPLSKGGLHTWDNVRLAHRRCNSIKGARI